MRNNTHIQGSGVASCLFMGLGQLERDIKMSVRSLHGWGAPGWGRRGDVYNERKARAVYMKATSNKLLNMTFCSAPISAVIVCSFSMPLTSVMIAEILPAMPVCLPNQ